MKKIFLTLLLLSSIGLSVFAADVVPNAISLNYTNTFGVYQVGHAIVIYSEPNEKSAIKEKIVWDDENVLPKDLRLTDLFVVYIGNKDLALMAVTDETDDWVEVIYNNTTGEKG